MKQHRIAFRAVLSQLRPLNFLLLLAAGIVNAVGVTMFLMNGFQMRGVVTGFDSFVVVLTSEGRQQVVYKHAISTIAPERPVELRESPEVHFQERG